MQRRKKQPRRTRNAETPRSTRTSCCSTNSPPGAGLRNAKRRSARDSASASRTPGRFWLTFRAARTRNSIARVAHARARARRRRVCASSSAGAWRYASRSETNAATKKKASESTEKKTTATCLRGRVSGSVPRASWRLSLGGTCSPSTAPRWRLCSAARRAPPSLWSCATPPPKAKQKKSRTKSASCGNCATERRSRRWRLRFCAAARRSRRSGPPSPRWAPSRNPRARSSWTRRVESPGDRARTSASSASPATRSASSRPDAPSRTAGRGTTKTKRTRRRRRRRRRRNHEGRLPLFVRRGA